LDKENVRQWLIRERNFSGHGTPPVIPDDVLTSAEARRSAGANSALSPAVGFPALSMPAGLTADGLPVGISLLGRPFAEGILFKIAHGYERMAPRREPPKTVPALPGEP